MNNMTTTIGTRTRTRIGQWNIRTLKEPSRLSQLEREMQKYNIQILGISEMRWPGSGEMQTAEGNLLIFSGGEVNNGQRGVGLIIAGKLRNSLISWKPTSDRIITARLYTRIRKVTIIQCYAPTEAADQADKEEFYIQLSSVMNEIPRTDIKILMGDFNAKVGSDTTASSAVGQYGLGSAPNNNGERLISLCQENNMKIGGTLFPHKDIHKYTWTSPDGRTRNQIDHICISHRWKQSLLDVRTRRGADMHSDHMLVTGDIRLRLTTFRSNTNARHKRLNTHKLADEDIARELTSRLEQSLSAHPTSNLQEVYRQIGEEVLGTSKNTRKKWISDETWEKIKERKELRLKLLNNNTNNDLRQEYEEKAKEVKKLARKDKRKFYSDIASEAQTAAEHNNMRTLYKNIQKLTNKGMRQSQPIRDRNGQLLTSTEEQINRWREHFNELNTRDHQQGQHTEDNPPSYSSNNLNTTRVNQQAPTTEEIIETINKLKNNKAEGADGIPAELYKATPNITGEFLKPILEQIWNTENITSEWKRGIIVKLPKKGDLTECCNWRGITILNAVTKILALIILSRIERQIEDHMREEQAGFRRNRGCTDQTNTLRIILEQSAEWNAPLFITFVDFERAFDTIDRSAIWTALTQKGIPSKLVRIIKALYSDAETSILHNGCLSSPLRIEVGVKQGCPLSPVLFNTVLDEVMKKAITTPRGINWVNDTHLEDLDYADDIALISHTHDDMQAKLDSLAQHAGQVGLKINAGKTKSMRLNTTNRNYLVVNNVVLEEVTTFKYLGSIMTITGGADEDTTNRLKEARIAFGRLRAVWNSSHIARGTKLRIFNSCVKSVLLYGSETWLAKKTTLNRLQVFVNKCLRIICRVFWPNRITNERLWEITNQEPIATNIRRRRWKWIGHVLRKPEHAIARQALEWDTNGVRKRGRPRTTWKRTIKNEIKSIDKTWAEIKETAHNRREWRGLVDALCSQGE